VGAFFSVSDDPPHRRRHVHKIIRALALVYACCVSDSATAQAADHQAKPTIVLVHGAFAESSSWNGVIAELNRDGFRTIAAANPLRGVASDAAAVSAVIGSIGGPVVLVGHSYGGPVITEAANGKNNVKALVYVAGFAPDKGESSLTLSGKFPGSTLGEALLPVARPDGGQDLYIQPEKFHEQFAADVPAAQASLMAATQRPVADAALAEPSDAPSWKTIPSYAIYGSADRNIPPAVMKFMAERAHSVKTIVVEGGSHALMVSRPEAIALLIEEAASAQ
jgi:pimeloyl-ACP methyl ester carboxylesterase